MRQLITALVLLGALPVAAQQGVQDGARIYDQGGDGLATLAGGQVVAPARRFPCARCHGRDATGGGEGATNIPAIGWPALTDPDRAGGAHDAASFARVLREGVRPDGSVLLGLMPRYDLDEDQIAALVTFLQSAPERAHQGIDATHVVLPRPADPDAAAGLDAFVSAFNQRGGAFGRRVMVAAAGQDAIAAPALYDAVDAALTGAESAALIAALVARRIARVAAPDQDRDLTYRLGQAGIAIDQDSPVVLALTTLPDGLEGKEVYATRLVLRNGAPLRLTRARAVHVAMPDEGEVNALLAAGHSGGFIDGHVAGLVLGAVLTGAGRQITADDLARAAIAHAAMLRIRIVSANALR